MNASDPANSNKLTDAQLDALLESADQELLLHIQANTDPTATLTELLATRVNPEDGRTGPAPADRGSKPGHPVHSERAGSHRRSWRIMAAAVAVAGAAVVAISVFAVRATHHPAGAVSFGVPGFMSALGVTTGTTSFYVPFTPGQSKLGISAVDELSNVLAVRSAQSVTAAIEIIGYPNDLRHTAHAGKLSGMRVQAVRNWLIVHHVPACALHTIYHGAPKERSQANALLDRNNIIIIIIRYANPAHPAQSMAPTYSCLPAAHSPN